MWQWNAAVFLCQLMMVLGIYLFLDSTKVYFGAATVGSLSLLIIVFSSKNAMKDPNTWISMGAAWIPRVIEPPFSPLLVFYLGTCLAPAYAASFHARRVDKRHSSLSYLIVALPAGVGVVIGCIILFLDSVRKKE